MKKISAMIQNSPPTFFLGISLAIGVIFSLMEMNMDSQIFMGLFLVLIIQHVLRGLSQDTAKKLTTVPNQKSKYDSGHENSGHKNVKPEAPGLSVLDSLFLDLEPILSVLVLTIPFLYVFSLYNILVGIVIFLGLTLELVELSSSKCLKRSSGSAGNFNLTLRIGRSIFWGISGLWIGLDIGHFGILNWAYLMASVLLLIKLAFEVFTLSSKELARRMASKKINRLDDVKQKTVEKK